MQDLFEPIMGRTNVLHSIKLKTQLHNILFLKKNFIKKYFNKRLKNVEEHMWKFSPEGVKVNNFESFYQENAVNIANQGKNNK